MLFSECNGLNRAEHPVADKEETAHFILEVTDKGEPSLSRCKRVVVAIINTGVYCLSKYNGENPFENTTPNTS
ncbi:MAG: hypothetical protein HC892_17275 [Saprospiraceae bacterium]|nr:hypothetical protein [Saprospiraceae bacterium]